MSQTIYQSPEALENISKANEALNQLHGIDFQFLALVANEAICESV